MDGIVRIDLKGHLPIVEYRRSADRFFVVFPTAILGDESGYELVMAFIHKWTAAELALNIYHGTPFYTHIPAVQYGTPYPRPWLIYPELTVDSLEMIFSEN